MSQMSVSAAVRQVLSKDLETPGDDLVDAVKRLGVHASREQILAASYNVRSVLRKRGVPTQRSADRSTTGLIPAPLPAQVQAVTLDPALSGEFSAVLSVAQLIDQCGGSENVERVLRQAKEMGSAEKMLNTVEVVKAVRGTVSK